MSRIPFKKTLIAAVTLAMACAIVVVPLGGAAGREGAAVSGPRDFTILHTNDEHSEVIPYDLAIDYPKDPTTGGFSRLANVIKDVKTAKAAAGEPVLTLNAGDWSKGSLFSWLETVAAPELFLLQQIGYDAATIGNHDVELGPQYLAAGLNAARAAGVDLPLISSNITFTGYPPNPASPDAALYNFYSQTDKKRSDLFIQPYTTRTLSNGLKVGIFGLLGVEAELVAPGAAPLSFGNVQGDPTSSISFINRVVVAQNMVGALRQTEKCDVVVCLSHMGTYEEEQLADFVPGIDVIVGGHSHDLNYPPIIRGVSKTIIVQAKAYTEYLGNLELRYDPGVTDGPKVTVRNASIIPIVKGVGTVPALDAVVDNYVAGLNATLGFDCLSPYAETDRSGDGGFSLLAKPPMNETNIGNLIADSYLAISNAVDPANPSVLAFEADGVIRSSVPKGAGGVFSFYDLFRVIPLGGSPYDPTTPGYPLVSFYLLGAEIQGVLNTILDLNRSDFFQQVSGMKFSFDPNAGEGQKLRTLAINNGAGTLEPVKPATLYKLTTNYYGGSFLAGTFGLFPRDAAGVQHKPPTYPDPMKEFIIHTAPSTGLKAWQALSNSEQHEAELYKYPAPATELKAWQALAMYVGGMKDLDGDGLPNVPPSYATTQGRITRLATAFHFAEGTCRPGFEPYITIQNPGSKDADVKITYMKGDGSTDTQELTVAKDSRATVVVKEKLGEGDDAAHDFSASVESTNSQEIIAERPMYFSYKGAWAGGHDVVGATAPAGAFYFAEGTCRPGFSPYICIQNPGGENASVTVTYMKGDGATETQGVTVVKNSRATVAVKDVLGEGNDAAHDFSAKVECTNGQVIIAERPMYFNYKPGEKDWDGGHNVMGAKAPATTFFFAEGTCRPGFEPYICIQNPLSADSNVKITYMKGDGKTETEELTVGRNSRSTVTVKQKLGEGDDAAHDFSAMVETTNNVPIIAERPMYFSYKGAWAGGHNVMGATMTSTTFFFAEGTCRPGFEPYITLQNPGSRDAEVKITYMKGDGTTDTEELTVAKNSRSTVTVKQKLGEGNDAAHDFSAMVECTNQQLILCERPMYFSYMGAWAGGTCVVGLSR